MVAYLQHTKITNGNCTKMKHLNYLSSSEKVIETRKLQWNKKGEKQKLYVEKKLN
jgi:hypothetical protein